MIGSTEWRGALVGAMALCAATLTPVQAQLLGGSLLEPDDDLLSPLTVTVADTLDSLAVPTDALEVGCDWILAYDADQPERGNFAFPETNVRYWVAIVSDTVPAGARLRAAGRFPDARYSAFHVHDGNLFVHDAISDNQIGADAGQVNRNLSNTRRDDTLQAGGSYVAYARINAAKPAVPESNTVYRPAPAAQDGQVKRRTVLAYRTYLAEGDRTGGEGLPTLTLETPDGERPLPHAADAAVCRAISDGLATPPSSLPVSLVPPLIPAQQPVFEIFDGAVINAVGLGVGFNPHNGFMSAKVDRDYADTILVRGKMPTFTTQDDVTVTPQVRYWSLCQNGANSTRVISCLADHDVPLDDEGYYTIVVGQTDGRPASLPEAFGWMPYGPEKVGGLLVRELLADPDFEQAIVNSARATAAADRGPFMPVLTYCDSAVLRLANLSGLSPAATYARCVASRAETQPLALPALGGLFRRR